MADYHFPTVAFPAIPATDLTPLERLVLGASFEVETVGEDLVYFFTSEGPNEFPSFDVVALRAAWTTSRDVESRLATPVAARLARYDAMDQNERDPEIDVDLTVFGCADRGLDLHANASRRLWRQRDAGDGRGDPIRFDRQYARSDAGGDVSAGLYPPQWARNVGPAGGPWLRRRPARTPSS